MSAIPEAKLEQVISRWETVQANMAQGTDQESYVKLAREFAELDPVVAAIREFRAAREERAGLDEIIADKDSDADMVAMAPGRTRRA